MKIALCPSPELYHLYHQAGATVIITDIFRASTTITEALRNGAERILPVATVDECQRIGLENGYLMAAERNTQRCSFAQLGNDPLAYQPHVVQGRTIIITTTNGTRSLTMARDLGAREILIGSFLNLKQTIQYLEQSHCAHVVLLAAGWRGQVAMEDCLYGGALCSYLEQAKLGTVIGDMAQMMTTLWQHAATSATTLRHYLERSEHYERLRQAGLLAAVDYCLTVGDAPAVRLHTDGFLYAETSPFRGGLSVPE